jgi:hypothetical protein
MHLGYFATAEEAAQVYAQAISKSTATGGAALTLAEQFRQDEEAKEEIDLEPFRSETNASGYRGVSWHSGTQKYRAQVR